MALNLGKFGQPKAETQADTKQVNDAAEDALSAAVNANKKPEQPKSKAVVSMADLNKSLAKPLSGDLDLASVSARNDKQVMVGNPRQLDTDDINNKYMTDGFPEDFAGRMEQYFAGIEAALNETQDTATASEYIFQMVPMVFQELKQNREYVAATATHEPEKIGTLVRGLRHLYARTANVKTTNSNNRKKKDDVPLDVDLLNELSATLTGLPGQ